jgi:hypothetical protein
MRAAMGRLNAILVWVADRRYRSSDLYMTEAGFCAA